MKNSRFKHILYPALLAGILLALFGIIQVLASSNIDETHKWSWGANVGWIDFHPLQFEPPFNYDEMTVYSDHMEGYAWSENVGWIRLGSFWWSGQTSYTNTNNVNYGVNNDGVGNLSGYAWGTNVGWINFDPAGSERVRVDPATGAFDGYAWGENVGWIHFNGIYPVYNVVTTWHGDLISPTYEHDIAALKYPTRYSARSAGLIIEAYIFGNEDGDGIIFGHNNAAFANVTDHLPAGVDKRWARIWQLDVHDGGNTAGSQVIMSFDISDAGGQETFSSSGTYFLLKRAAGSSDDFTIVPYSFSSVSGDRWSFVVNVSDLGSEFTLGATADSPTAVTLRSLRTASGNALRLGPAEVLALSGLLALGALTVVLWRKRQA